ARRRVLIGADRGLPPDAQLVVRAARAEAHDLCGRVVEAVHAEALRIVDHALARERRERAGDPVGGRRVGGRVDRLRHAPRAVLALEARALAVARPELEPLDRGRVDLAVEALRLLLGGLLLRLVAVRVPDDAAEQRRDEEQDAR